MDITKIKKLGWNAKTELSEGIKKTVLEYINYLKWNTKEKYL
jgi:dTDP-D-glucose 4,6-dehydratase